MEETNNRDGKRFCLASVFVEPKSPPSIGYDENSIGEKQEKGNEKNSIFTQETQFPRRSNGTLRNISNLSV